MSSKVLEYDQQGVIYGVSSDTVSIDSGLRERILLYVVYAQSWQYRDIMKPYFFSNNHNISTIQAFEQFGTLIILNPGDKYPYRPGFKPSTSQFRAITGPNRPSVPTRSATRHYFIMFNSILFFL